MPSSSSFTLASNGGLLRVLVTKCSISQGYDHASGAPIPQLIEFDAIWDTGATASVITQRVVDACGLQPIGMTQVQGVHGASTVETYLVNIHLPNKVGVQHVQVTKGNLGDGASVLIGMDIITLGDFCITNKDGKTIFSFRVPSQNHVDYVKEHGVFQGSCRVDRFHYAASGSCNAGRSGLSMTAPIGSQFRVFPDHRSGRFAFAAS